MTRLSDTEAFRRQLVSIINNFRANEQAIREQYATDERSGTLSRELLERPTRRFLIDKILVALGWSPDDPSRVTEEARAQIASAQRLYFDYLGIAPGTRRPVLLIEAKGFDTLPLRFRRRSRPLDAISMADLLVRALDAMNRGDDSIPIVSEWAAFLRDLKGYVASLGPVGQATLSRVVITSAQWIIVFEEPLSAFISSEPFNPEHIHCFVDLDDILDKHVELFALLHRDRLVDGLPLALEVQEALSALDVANISEMYRGVVIATSASGSVRRPYPTRAVYAAAIVRTGNRFFAIVDYDNAVEEPLATEEFARFSREIQTRRDAFDRRLAAVPGWPGIAAKSIDVFPGFPSGRSTSTGLRTRGFADASIIRPPLAGSSADRLTHIEAGRRNLIEALGYNRSDATEFVVVTGLASFYRAMPDFG